MINKVKDINESQLQSMIAIGLETINHKNLYNKEFTKDDINTIVSNDGFNLIIELHNSKTTISVIDADYQAKMAGKVDELMAVMLSPLSEGLRYQVHLNSDLNLFMYNGDDTAFKDKTDAKINFYDEQFNLVFVQESFYCFNYNDNKFHMDEFYIGYDFDKDYNPLGKLFVGSPKDFYKNIDDRFKAKLRVYRNEFNIDDEKLILKHYFLMDLLEDFDDIFTQFYGPNPQKLDMDLIKSQFELASIILFN